MWIPHLLIFSPWMQDCLFTCQPRLHDLQSPRQGLSCGIGCEAETMRTAGSSTFMAHTRRKNIYSGKLKIWNVFEYPLFGV